MHDSTDLFASGISTNGSGWAFLFVLGVSVLSQVHSIPRCSLTGQCAHLSIWAGLSTPRTCASPGLKTLSPLCYSLGQSLVEHFCKDVKDFYASRCRMTALRGFWEARNNFSRLGWTSEETKPVIAEHWVLRHRGSPKTAASAAPRSVLCPTFHYFTYEQKETIKILLFPG